ncbi:hypothetical protein ACHAXS_002561, partial [Conticribra weissflogii]
MASNLHGSGGPTSLDSSLLSDLLLRYGTSSTLFRYEMAQWTEWLANDSPPWAAYRATMATRAVAFNKFPGVRPLSIGESYRRLWARLIISQTRDQAKAACNTTELCAGLEAGIDGAIHAVRASTINKSSFQSPIDTYHEDSSSHTTESTPQCTTNHTPDSSLNPSPTSINLSSPTSSSIKSNTSSSTSTPSTSTSNPPTPSPTSNQPLSTSPPISPNTTTFRPTSTDKPTITHCYNLRTRPPQSTTQKIPHHTTPSSSIKPNLDPSTSPKINSSSTTSKLPTQPSKIRTTTLLLNSNTTTPPPTPNSSSTQKKSSETNQTHPSHSPTPTKLTSPQDIPLTSPPNSPSPTTSSSTHSSTSNTPQDYTLDPLDVTLLDASNGFNEISRLRCLHTIRHLWPSASRFAFNCYRHSIQVCIRQHNSPATIIPGNEGIQQGDPLSMILYGLALTPLIERVHTKHSSIFLSENFLDPWYADDATIVASVSDTIIIVQAIQTLGPIYGYYIQPEKSFHICSSSQISKSKPLFDAANLHFQYVEGTRYLGSYIGEKDFFPTWIKPQIQTWVSAVQDLSLAAVKYPQAAYAVFTHCLQNQWSHLCRTTPNLGPFLTPIEQSIKDSFLPALFHVDNIDNPLREVISHPIKLAGLNILDPTIQAGFSYDTSLLATESLVDCLLYHSEIDLQAHHNNISQIRQQCHKKIHTLHEDLLTKFINTTSPEIQHRLTRAKMGGSWLTVIPKAINGTILSAEEFRDNLRLRYGFTPEFLPKT